MFHDVCAAADIAEGGLLTFSVAGRKVVLAKAGGSWYAVSNACGHLGAGLDKATLDGTILTCPLHCAQFDITTGQALSGPLPPDPQHPTHDLVCYPVRLRTDRVEVNLEET